ncbi:hypothetical protein LguiA_013294 [Lonicera macranthoides]
MDSSGLGGGFLSGSSGGFLDLDSSIHRHQQTQLSNSSHTHTHTHNQNQNHHMKSSMNAMTGLEDDPSSAFMEGKGVNLKGFSMNFGKGKVVSPVNNNMSEDDEPSFNEDGNGENFNGGKGKQGSPWQRMKWTDNIVRLLIQVVACVGDDGMPEGAEGVKRRSGSLQKKGKWKTVSKIMIAKGCYVSPQQCEDKFNDLNKRYKRLNDILGRGTSCRVVENPSLMDSMPQLSAKMKEDVKKILSSKHLFYKEICAYHNGQRIPNCSDLDLHVQHLPVEKENTGFEVEEGEEHDESDEDESDEEENINAGGDVERVKMNEEDGNFWSQSNGQDCFQTELAEFFQDPTKGQWEQREYIKKRMLQVQEQRLGIQAEAYELEKRRFKWQRFCSKKNRELEMSKLENERLILENERMALILKHKELEMDFKNSSASFDPTSLSIDMPQGREHIDLSRHHQ